MRRNVPIGDESLSPTGQQQYDRSGCGGLDRAGDLAAIDVRHAEIGDDDVKEIALRACDQESVDAGLSAVGGGDAMTVALQGIAHGLDDKRIIIHDEYAERPGGSSRTGVGCRWRGGAVSGETQANGSALTDGTVYLDIGAVALHGAVNHGEPKTGTAFAFRGEEGLQTSASRVLIHPNAGVDDLELNVTGGSVAHDGGSQGERAALGHRIDGIENEVDESLAKFAVGAPDRGKLRCQFGPHLDDDAALLGHVAPAGASQLDDLLNETVQVDGEQGHLGLALPIEFTHAGDGLRHIVDGALDRFEVPTGLWAEAGLSLQ